MLAEGQGQARVGFFGLPPDQRSSLGPAERPDRTAILPLLKCWLSQYVSFVAAGLVCATFVAVVLVPLVTGWVRLTVLTGSMSPGMPPGSLAVVQRIGEDQVDRLKVGDVITFMPKANSDQVVTHRVTGIEQENGKPVFTTKGDANSAADPTPVRSYQVRAKLRYSMPLAGFVATWLDRDQKLWSTIVLVALLLGYVLYTVIREAKAKPDGPAKSGDEGDQTTSPPKARPRIPWRPIPVIVPPA